MAAAHDLRGVRRRLSDFLEREDRSRRSVTLRRILKEQFLCFDRVAVVGGMVRDFARHGAAAFCSDVDLVIEAPVSDIARLAARVGAYPNRFGGYAWVAGGWKIDFWALETTWALREGHVDVSRIEDVTRCVFFDGDAIAYELRSRTLICAPDYLSRVVGHRMDLVLASTPSVEGNLLRSLRRIAFWQIAAGPALQRFIDDYLTEESFEKIAATERRLYTRRVTHEYPSVEAIRHRVNSIARHSETEIGAPIQMDLPGL